MFNKLQKLFARNHRDDQMVSCITTDIHSHLLPGIDDGVESFEESIDLIRRFSNLGYKRMITTPHIMQDFFRNEPGPIRELGKELQELVRQASIPMEIDVAAEYYLDEGLMEKIEHPSELLLFGKKYLLFETSFINKPIYFKEFIFKCTSQGIVPVLAHPERYAYVHNDSGLLPELRQMGVLLQLNANSLAGYYSKEVRKLARKLINDQLVTFVGSDCHSEKHMAVFENVVGDPFFKKACRLPLLNAEI